MHISATFRLAAAALIAALCGCAQPTHQEARYGHADACADTPAELRRQLVSNQAMQRLDGLRDFIQRAAHQSGHRPHGIVTTLLADPLALTAPATARPSLFPAPDPLLLSGANPLDAVIERFEAIHAQLDTALAAVTDEQARRLRLLLPGLLDRTSNGRDLEAFEHGAVLVEIQAAIDPPALQKTAALLAGLAEPELADALADYFRGRTARPAPAWLGTHVAGEILHAERTSRGAVIVGGPDNNIYTGPAALIIDTGGNDTYALPPGDRVRIVIDLHGDDTYTAAADSALAGSVLGASLIADHAGNDTYAGGRIAQGAAVAGVGMLYDRAGDDRYFAEELAQGASLAGIGVLIDASGNDLYSSAKFAQGFGGALGVGVLVDEGGNDIYLAGNKHRSSYELPGNYQAFSQGVGMGFRNDIAGGIGLLHDLGGDDRYAAGNFSQGTGYYLGGGFLLDEGGHDAYLSGRYAQGSAAHIGIGVLRDEAGNDTYTGSPSASQGAAWDLALSALVDCAGNDRYQANEFALGAAAQNAIAFFIDKNGRDTHNVKRDAFGHGGPTDYHGNGNGDESNRGIGNLGVFIDVGDQDGEHNGTIRISPARNWTDKGRDRVPDASKPKIPSASPGRPAQTDANPR